MLEDFHMHTNFSADADPESTPRKMIEASIEKGLTGICITDHEDIDYPPHLVENGFLVDYDKYFSVLQPLKEEYKDRIYVGIGVEFGLQPYLAETYQTIAKKYPFDFIIGSVHLIDKKDPYSGEYYMDKTDEEGFQRGFEVILENIKAYPDFDVLGHIDYMVRYAHETEKRYRPADYQDVIDEILKYLIDTGKGIEFNTSGFKYGLSFGHPHPDILKRYKELGGEIITIGADGHKPEHIAYDFHRVSDILRSCGFKNYTEFRGRKPIFRQLP